MIENNYSLFDKIVFRVLIATFGFNILIHLLCMYDLVFGIDELKVGLSYVFTIIPLSAFLAIAILIFNFMKKVKSAKFEYYMT